jgi:hypothetical protein
MRYKYFKYNTRSAYAGFGQSGGNSTSCTIEFQSFSFNTCTNLAKSIVIFKTCSLHFPILLYQLHVCIEHTSRMDVLQMLGLVERVFFDNIVRINSGVDEKNLPPLFHKITQIFHELFLVNIIPTLYRSIH